MFTCGNILQKIDFSKMDIINIIFLKQFYKMFIINSIYNFSLLYTAYIFIHYLAANLYSHLCTSFTWKGLFVSPFIISTPHCRALRWTIQNTSNNIEAMWAIIGTWICTNIISKIPSFSFYKNEETDKKYSSKGNKHKNSRYEERITRSKSRLLSAKNYKIKNQ